MKKSILNLGKALNKAEQKEVNGGKVFGPFCKSGACYSNNWVSAGNENGDVCAVLFGYGDHCRGTINNNQCCLN
ncbi:hypothetical protein H3Z83_07635 [Tenacibaculum sp. S7007]|uniref:Bacteriocin n=1 Tax=Tenacibaculum pelagium TaxID=2759527 RepID=A0A839AMS6_9FLAO|nr:hypothetical protein [Tenacibaculum pelagium]MBA6156383.1 hypothetical protein [Tenacibaculum pelagium]